MVHAYLREGLADCVGDLHGISIGAKWYSRFGSHDLAPERGFEPRTLRLTDRCSPFKTGCSNSLSATTCRHLPRFIAGVAVRATLSRSWAGRPLDHPGTRFVLLEIEHVDH